MSDLNPTERLVLNAILAGKNNREIAQDARMAIGTVKDTCTRIYAKRCVKSRAELIVFYYQAFIATHLFPGSI